jgi:tRNA pseudouridine13 synthase
MTRIASQGVPNYFGEQRFGIRRQNLQEVDDWFGGKRKIDRFKRSLYLSAARSWLFNLVLAERVRQANWCEPLMGDVYVLEGSKRFFYEPQLSDEIRRRVAQGDIHPSAPLWGEGELLTTDAVKLLEETVVSEWPEWQQGLQRAGLKQQRRAIRVIPRELTYAYDETEHILRLGFALPAGCYATGLLRELIAFSSDLSGEFELVDE